MLRRLRSTVLVPLLAASGLALWTSFISPAHKEKRYERTRIEGLSAGASLLHGIGYIRKYIHKRTHYGAETREYFSRASAYAKAARRSTVPAAGMRLSFVGDIMWTRSNWDSLLSPAVLAYLGKSDVLLGNLESPVDTTHKAPGFFPDYPAYNSEAGLVRGFRRGPGGRNLLSALSLANNHCLDRGPEGLLNTIAFLEKEGIAHHGAGVYKTDELSYIRIEKEGFKIGFFAATAWLNPGNKADAGRVSINRLTQDPVNVKAVLQKMDTDGIDFKVLYLHWGYEYELYPDTAVINMAHQLVAAGADLIIGSHSHVVQPPEIIAINGYRDRHADSMDCPLKMSDKSGVARKAMVVYSCGNFLTAMYTPLCRLGVIHSIGLYRDKATGRADWTCQDSRLVYNAPENPVDGKRKLLFLEDYLEAEKNRDPGKAAEISRQVAVIRETGAY